VKGEAADAVVFLSLVPESIKSVIVSLFLVL
jgi:hypothetical protein